MSHVHVELCSVFLFSFVRGPLSLTHVLCDRSRCFRSGRYVLVTAYYKKPNLRFVVYVSESSSKYELSCVHKDIADKDSKDLDPNLVKVRSTQPSS